VELAVTNLDAKKACVARMEQLDRTPGQGDTLSATTFR
jgi:hypothetical protein